MEGVLRSEPELSLKLGSSCQDIVTSPPRDEIMKKKMTIFFNGEMRVLDVTETQVYVYFLFLYIFFYISLYIYI